MFSTCAQTLSVEWTNCFYLGMLEQYFFKEPGSSLPFAAYRQHLSSIGFQHRVVRLNSGSSIEFQQSIVIATLIHEYSRSAPANHNGLSRIKTQGFVETA